MPVKCKFLILFNWILVSDARKQMTHDGLVWHANIYMSLSWNVNTWVSFHVDISTLGHIYFSMSHSPSCIICILSPDSFISVVRRRPTSLVDFRSQLSSQLSRLAGHSTKVLYCFIQGRLTPHYGWEINPHIPQHLTQRSTIHLVWVEHGDKILIFWPGVIWILYAVIRISTILS